MMLRVGHPVLVNSPVDLGPAAERLARLVEVLPDDALDRPTPCEAYTVAALLDHIASSIAAFQAAAVKDPLPGRPSGDAANLDRDWRSRIPRDTRALADAWDDPTAWTGMTSAGGVDLPGEVAGIVALDELVIHGWDLAKATDQPADFDGPGLEAVLRLVTQFRGGGVEGLFGPELPVPASSPLFERILGITGRDPHWEPPRAGS
jgi:uncharacterized protein (TIGR03086 family)